MANRVHAAAVVHYGDTVHWAAIFTAIGEMLGGLAVVLAFVQLGALREDRLRAQVSKIGVWTGAPEHTNVTKTVPDWKIPLLIRNGSKLPVVVRWAELSVLASGQELVRQRNASGRPRFVTEYTGDWQDFLVTGGTIPPGETWEKAQVVSPTDADGAKLVPMARITRAFLADAAGRQWEMRPHKGGPPRQVRWWRKRRALL